MFRSLLAADAFQELAAQPGGQAREEGDAGGQSGGRRHAEDELRPAGGAHLAGEAGGGGDVMDQMRRGGLL